jgi:hypothetical protein|uniref:Uncharacterized protein n=1 Tax=viral metagenome TaxID=1070528 RepID=A0A6C0IWF5_9ZZZZ
MINLLHYKNIYFSDQLFISQNDLLDDFRNIGIKNNHSINPEINNLYNESKSIDLLKLISDKVFFFQDDPNIKNSSIKNMLYQNKLFYQDFYKNSNIESYLYRLINENVNRTLIFFTEGKCNEFAHKNNMNNITLPQKIELINNLDNDIVYLSSNIILIRHQVYLPWLWTCRDNPFENLKNLSNSYNNIKTYYLKNKWNFMN